ncbi:DUF4026 domain-containing protein [Dysgonomonas sp. BGC7]|uniref:DUF4026 domain-containing protein n=1 Tax=Dysgonomonas sp. BGC7 TaxID=1658008 RepID=UPI0006800ACD|nr:DUF4026 domain-containing protein [Dysgonomonas sp. BGC7]MBD8387157.1 DUF4026 domain-containing protein [Dysgonomonas sp. BGC7]
MDNNEKYELLETGETGLSSVMGVFPSDKNFKFDAAHIEKSLSINKAFELKSFSRAEIDTEYSVSAFNAEIEYKGASFNVELYVCAANNINLRDYGFANAIDEESLNRASEQEFYLETSMYFELDPLTSFHLQLKIMDAVVPQASLVIDFMSYRLLSAKWLSMTAKSQTPPSPDYLYTLHCVYDEVEGGNRRYWFHTHGLHRCASVELEMLNFSQGAEQMNTLINMTVKKFLTHPAREKERFTIGYDGMGINLCWLRWEEALKDLPKDILGSFADRDEVDSVHAEPSGVLFAVEDGNMVSPEIYAPTLAENPIYYITNEETARMSALAKERFSTFERVFNKEYRKPEKKSFLKKMFGSKEEEDDSKWTFLVKLGLSVDDAQANSEKEHLWFDVLSIDGGTIEGKLLNQPYWISGLNEGDIKSYPLEVLTDWLIYSPDNTYTSDSIYQLEY